MHRPPLQELPLHQFLPDNKQCRFRSNKRPLSPGAPVISPAKRRNLTPLHISSSEKTFKSPQSSLRHSFTSPSRFTDVLAGTASPAKVLDFGLPKHLAGDPEKRSVAELIAPPTPVRPHLSTSRLAPSPELKSRAPPPAQQDATPDTFDSPIVRPQSISTSSDVAYVLIPREMPPRLEPHSIHYPGFPVYQDTHIVAFRSSPRVVCRDEMEDDEDCKENIYVPPSVAKSITTPRGSNPYKLAPETNEVRTPDKFRPAHSSRTPRPIAPHSSLATGYKSGATMSLDKKKIFRRRLQDELDFEEGVTGDE